MDVIISTGVQEVDLSNFRQKHVSKDRKLLEIHIFYI